MIWRNLQATDVAAAYGLNALAGWNQVEADWNGYLAFEPEGCFAVEIEGALAGTAITIRYGGAVGWIGMVLVRPDRRRLGLGTALLRKSIGYLQSRGTGSIKLDATPMGRKVYLPLGFRDEHEVARWEGRTPAGAGSGSGEGVAPFDAMPLEQIADFDAGAFGVSRGEVLAALNGRSPRFCFVARRARAIEGYLIAREGREAVQVGPWIARDAAAAERLWSAFCRAVPDRRAFLDIPAPNTQGSALLASFGFKVQRSFTRMYLGNPDPRGEPGMVYGTGGAEKG